MKTRYPKIAIVGRPNVGKSALFNRICNKRIAIVDEAEGVTRDRLYVETDLFGKTIQIIDTGGIDPFTKIGFQEEIRRQAEIAIEEADSIILVVDSRIGITRLDEEVAKILLRTKKPVVLAVNKVDAFDQQSVVHEFYSLGISNIVPVSAVQGLNIAELLETALKDVDLSEVVEEVEDTSIKVAIIGRANAGKSTLVNYLLDEPRCVVSPIPGTTRDSIDVRLTVDGQDYTIIDTAGIRRKKAEHEVVDKFAAIRTERAIERADVCVLMLDARSGVTAQEKKIASQIEEAGKGCVMVFNKWDLVKGFRMEHCLQGLREEVTFLNHCPALFVSAKTGRNVSKILQEVKRVNEEQHLRISTGQLNRFMERAIQKYHPPMIQGKRLRIYYMAQVGTAPPHFVMFVNYPDLMVDSYKKYLINKFREEYNFSGVPLLFSLREREKTKEQKDAPAAVEKQHDTAEEEPIESTAEPVEEDIEEEALDYEDMDESYFS